MCFIWVVNVVLRDSEKGIITAELAKGKTTLEIAKMIGRYHQTVKNFARDPTKVRQRADKGQSRDVSRRSMLRIKREAVKNHGLSSGKLFEHVRLRNVSKSTRCRRLKKIAKSVKPVSKPPLKKCHMQNRLKWAEDNIYKKSTSQMFCSPMKRVLLLMARMFGAKNGY